LRKLITKIRRSIIFLLTEVCLFVRGAGRRQGIGCSPRRSRDFPGPDASPEPFAGSRPSPGHGGEPRGDLARSGARERIAKTQGGGPFTMIPHPGFHRACATGRLAIAAAIVPVARATECRGDLLSFGFDPNRPVIVATDRTETYSRSTGVFSV